MESFPAARFFLLLPVAMGVNDQQGKNDESADQQHNDYWLMFPDLAHEAGEIIKHLDLMYTD